MPIRIKIKALANSKVAKVFDEHDAVINPELLSYHEFEACQLLHAAGSESWNENDTDFITHMFSKILIPDDNEKIEIVGSVQFAEEILRIIHADLNGLMSVNDLLLVKGINVEHKDYSKSFAENINNALFLRHGKQEHTHKESKKMSYSRPHAKPMKFAKNGDIMLTDCTFGQFLTIQEFLKESESLPDSISDNLFVSTVLIQEEKQQLPYPDNQLEAINEIHNRSEIIRDLPVCYVLGAVAHFLKGQEWLQAFMQTQIKTKSNKKSKIIWDSYGWRTAFDTLIEMPKYGDKYAAWNADLLEAVTDLTRHADVNSFVDE